MTATWDDLRPRFQAAVQARLPTHLDRIGWNSTRIDAHQRDRLRHLLTHATTHSPFHARRLKGLSPETVELGDLGSLPVMTKQDLMTAFDDVLTDRSLTLHAVDTHLAATADTPSLLDGDRFATTSGGSSGMKGVFVHSWDAMVDLFARMMAGGGAHPPGPGVIGLVVSPSPVHPSGLIASLAGFPPKRVVRVPVTLPVAEIVARLNEAQPDRLLGYPSVIRRLAAEQAAGRLLIRPSGIMVGAERLDEATAGEIGAAFGAPILNMFMASEGLIGACRPGAEAFTFWRDLAIIELVDEHNKPVPAGTRSARVLVTNLFNPVQPLIRYAIEDQLLRRSDASDHGHLIATVEGRGSEAFVYGETRVQPKTLFEPVMQVRGVLDWQVRQTKGGVDVDLLVQGDVNPPRLAADIGRALTGAGMREPSVSLRLVDELIRDARTGKLRRWVPLEARSSASPVS